MITDKDLDTFIRNASLKRYAFALRALAIARELKALRGAPPMAEPRRLQIISRTGQLDRRTQAVVELFRQQGWDVTIEVIGPNPPLRGKSATALMIDDPLATE